MPELRQEAGMNKQEILAEKIEEIIDGQMWDETYPQWRELTPSDIPIVSRKIAEILTAQEEAPIDNGIPELDALCKQYNSGEIDLTALVCRAWNIALTAQEGEDEYYNSDPSKWTEKEHRYFIRTHALRWGIADMLTAHTEPEDDNQITRRKIMEYISDEGIDDATCVNLGKVIDWLDQQEDK
jgi:hypothetical protein